jgi:hypothetical protein
LALVVVGLGCNAAPELETWPVTGTVVDQTGASLTSGAVRFFAHDETQGDPHLITVAPIQADGSFTTKTHRKGFDYEGTVAGEYRIMVITDKSAAGERTPVQFDVPERFTVEPRENTLNLKIVR